MSTEQDTIDAAVQAVIAAVRAGDTAALYEAVMPPAGGDTPPDQAARWFGLLLLHLALAAARACELRPGCSREAVAQWTTHALGPLPTPALIRGADPARIDHHAAASAARDYAQYIAYTVDLLRVGLTPPGEEVDTRVVDAHQAATNNKTARINVIALLARLAAVPSRHD
ncbi:hypothetical protein [Kitasatospora kifunensis]|uniref:Uncharacterized protein n=1 Tax=Kitasatospora kifunensis TaxID=58351 RepID=A0A7W7R9Y4_KITKI|nr:hypothetical protein [Kitasatospora kifunensis]MBB4928113.1 hypothetical protein [Kitasatospora kifunensis]